MNETKDCLITPKHVDIACLNAAILECRRRLTVLTSPEKYDLQSDEFFLELGYSFRDIRKAMGFSQEELGGMMGICQNRISLIEQGKARIRLEEARKYQILIFNLASDGSLDFTEKCPDTLIRKFEEARIFLNSDGLKVLEDTIDNLKNCSALKRLH